jgi:uncharacterized membrane protein YbhN (UPF0104 family)
MMGVWVADADETKRRRAVVLLTMLGAALYLAGTIGIASVAGFSAVWYHVREVKPGWVVAALLGVAVSWLGYYLAFLGIQQIPGGPDLSRRERIATIAVGFGSFFYKGGAAVDTFAMKRGGTADRVAKVRVNALKSMEHAPIAIGTCIASIFLLALGRADPPPLDFIWPWAICPVIGGAIAVTLAARFRERLRDETGRVKQTLGIALDGIWLLREMAIGGKSRGLPFFGMALFWGADIFALWAALKAFSAGGSLLGVILGYAVGYVLTRRSAPLGAPRHSAVPGSSTSSCQCASGPVVRRSREPLPGSPSIASSACGCPFRRRWPPCRPCEPSATRLRRRANRRSHDAVRGPAA